MNLKDFMDTLSDLELSQIVFGNKDAEGNFARQDALIRIINRGVTELHSKFLLSKGELYLNIESKEGYRVDIRDDKYVLSPDDTTRIHKILQVFDHCGNDLDFNKINRTSDCREENVYMVNKYTLVFNRCCGIYRILFQYAPILTEIKDTYNWEEEEIDLPIEFMNALVYYVTMNLHSINPSNRDYTNAVSPSINYARKYSEEVVRLKEENVEIDGLGNNTERFNASSFI